MFRWQGRLQWHLYRRWKKKVKSKGSDNIGATRKYGKHKKWTEEEIEKLKQLREKYTKADIAKKLGRTPSSISNKVRELGLGGLMDNTEKWSFEMIAEAVGVNRSTIRTTWVKHGLKFQRRQNYCLVEEREFLRFMKENPDRWSALKCDYYMFYRHEWFMQKYEREKKDNLNIITKDRSDRWSDYEIQQFKSMKRRGFTHKQIACELGRTKLAVDHISMRLNKKGA